MHPSEKITNELTVRGGGGSTLTVSLTVEYPFFLLTTSLNTLNTINTVNTINTSDTVNTVATSEPSASSGQFSSIFFIGGPP